MSSHINTLRLGVLGFSEGNGHPYSWSAIFNGYDPKAMEQCGFPVIPRYLEKQAWPDARIKGAQVTHLWTQDFELSSQISRATHIPHILTDPIQMLGAIDGVLLARDDSENHLQLARPFLEAGLPIYIDKPIAITLENMEAIYQLEKYPGQIFTCSALRYSPELAISPRDREHLGIIREIHAITPKAWDKYAVHIIEPVLNMLGEQDTIEQVERQMASPEGGALAIRWSSGVTSRFQAMGGDFVAPISLRVFGSRGWRDFFFLDSYEAFRRALQDFVDGIRDQSIRSPRNYNKKVVQIISKIGATECKQFL